MEPAVPFAALGTVTLLAVAGWVVLGGAGLVLRGARPPALLLLAGALGLAAVDVALAVRFNAGASDTLALLRAACALLVAGGLALGALDPDPGRRLRAAAAPVGPLGVVVPLGAGALEASVAAAACLAAAALALRERRDVARVLLAGGLLAASASAAASALAGDSAGWALAVLLLRGLAAVLLLAGVLALGRRSLLAKVVAAILGGVLLMATAAFGIVGTAVVDSYEAQADELITDTARARVARLLEQPARFVLTARLLKEVAELPQGGALQASLEAFAPDEPGSFFARVDGDQAQLLVSKEGLRALDEVELRGLPQALPVEAAIDTRQIQSSLARLQGGNPRLVSLVAVPVDPEPPATEVTEVYVFGTPVDDSDLNEASVRDGYRVSVLSGDPLTVTASNRDDRLEDGDPRERFGDTTRARTLPARGDEPTLRFEPIPDLLALEGSAPLGWLAVSRDADFALAGQRRALTALLAAALVATGLVGLLALLLGRRTVEPVRRLTAAAERVAAGDLSTAAPAVRSQDEIGALARTFATMTGSLAALTGDLRSTAARLETVLASMSDGLLSTDAEGRVTSANRAALVMLGREEQEVLGAPLREAVDVRDPEGAPLADPGLRLADAAGEVHRADGTTLPVRVALTGLRSEEDPQEGRAVVLVLRDTTREREVERMKTEFLSNVSHELRTPLTPIRGYADILTTRSDRLQPAQVAAFAGTILSETLKMNRVVDLLVDVAALEAGRVRLRPRDVEVRDLVEARLEAWRAKVPARAADLRKRVASGLPPVHVDPEWVAKALDELLDNALKHTPEGTAVTLTATVAPDGERVRVAVKDAGPGIAEADQALLFTSFEQVDGSATRRVGGLGLGLSFVRRLAEDTGLPLTVTSTLGRGSEFALDLPAGEAPGRVPAPRRRRAAARR